MRSGVWSRVLGGLGANASGQAATIVIQLASVPAFLHFWSIEEYGQWLLLSALPGYLALSDLGLGTVAMNRMTMLHARGQLRESRVVFQTSLLMITIVTGLLFVVSSLVIWSIQLEMFRPQDARTTMTLLVIVALLNVQSFLLDAVWRASGQFAVGTYLINLGRIIEWLGGIAALFIFRSALAVASGFLVARLAVMFTCQLIAARRFPNYPWSFADASSKELKEMMRPALSFLAFPLGNALTIQGISVVIGTSLGPTALAVFNTYRTLTRLPIQMLATFSRSLWPEISRCYGMGDSDTLRRLYRSGTTLSLLACAAACLAIYAGGSWMLQLWTGSRIPVEPLLLELLLLATFCNCAWQVGQVVLAATNRHERLAAVYLLTAIMSISAAVLMPIEWGLTGMAAVVGAFEVALLLASRRLVIEVVSKA